MTHSEKQTTSVTRLTTATERAYINDIEYFNKKLEGATNTLEYQAIHEQLRLIQNAYEVWKYIHAE